MIAKNKRKLDFTNDEKQKNVKVYTDLEPCQTGSSSSPSGKAGKQFGTVQDLCTLSHFFASHH